MRGRAPNYPGLSDPRAAMARYWDAYRFTLKLEQCFHVASPAREPLEAIRVALRGAAFVLARDPHFFGGVPCGQTVYAPPIAPPIPGIVRIPLANGSGRKHPT